MTAMAETQSQSEPDAVRMLFTESKHARLLKRYMGEAGFVAVGEKGQYGRVDPETGAEYEVLIGPDNRHSSDYKVGGVYPATTFVKAVDMEDRTLSHGYIKGLLVGMGMWSDRYSRVIIPKGYEYGEATWYNAFKYAPPGSAPSLSRLERSLERKLEEDAVFATRSTVEACISPGED